MFSASDAWHLLEGASLILDFISADSGESIHLPRHIAKMTESSQQATTPKSLFVQQYLDSTVLLTTTQRPDEISLVARLCAEAMAFFKTLVKRLKAPDPVPGFSDGDIVNIHNSYQQLVLWADGYGIPGGDLDEVFARSSLARHATLEILISLSQTLVEGTQRSSKTTFN